LGHDVALKVIDGCLAAQPEARERFLREARTAARLRHPNVEIFLFFLFRGLSFATLEEQPFFATCSRKAPRSVLRSSHRSDPRTLNIQPMPASTLMANVVELKLRPAAAIGAKGTFVTTLYHHCIGQPHARIALSVSPMVATCQLYLTLPTIRYAHSDIKSVIVGGRPALPREDQVAQ
jgi:serine/threonine protein kinase